MFFVFLNIETQHGRHVGGGGGVSPIAAKEPKVKLYESFGYTCRISCLFALIVQHSYYVCRLHPISGIRDGILRSGKEQRQTTDHTSER